MRARAVVIATGFPEGDSGETSRGGIERSLFAMEPMQQEETRGKIFNEAVVQARPEPAPEPVKEEKEVEPLIPSILKTEKRREEPVVTAQPKPREESPKTVTPPSAQQSAPEEEDEAWGAIPSFLRRHKK